MIRLLNYFIIALDNIWDEGDVDGLIYMNANHYIDQERDRFERKVKKGIIYNAPIGYSNDKFMPIDPGAPNPKIFIGHDGIQLQVNQGYEWSNAQYNPSTCPGYKYLTRGDYAKMLTGKKGDEVYFHPRVTEPENFLKEENGLQLYRADVTDLILIGDIPQGGWLLVKPHLEDNERDGMVISLEDQDKMLEGTVKYCRAGSGLNVGDEVIFQEDANWDFMIGDERLYAMMEEDVFLVATPRTQSGQ